MLSIIVPTLNEAQTIAESLMALQPLRDQGVEIIVVDGGSEDDCLHLATPWCDLAVVARRGRASQMNAGAQLATGDMLLFLHSDTMLPVEASELVEASLKGGDRVWGRFDVQIEPKLIALRLVAVMMNIRSRLTGIATGDQAIFVRRKTFEQIGGFPEIALMEDIALSKVLRRQSLPVCLKTAVKTSGRRWEKNGIAKTILLMWRLRLEYFLGVEPSRLAERYADARRDT